MPIRQTISITALIVFTSVMCTAQERRQAPSGRQEYNTRLETNVAGIIVREYVGPMGELLIVETTVEGKPLHLFIGPPDVVKKRGVPFKPGAPFEAIGMPGFKVNGGTAMLIREFKSGGFTLTLRDASGKATW